MRGSIHLAGGRGLQAITPRFELLDPSRTGITFSNTLPEDTTFNILNYLYYYNGGGVAVGDINNDGLPDLYFSSNRGSNRLYLNKGNYQFEDITERAGVADSVGWKTGVTMADVNGDGYVDIYVSGVSYLGMHGRNVLYINNGDGVHRQDQGIRPRLRRLLHRGLFSTTTTTATWICICSTTRSTRSTVPPCRVAHRAQSARGRSALPKRRRAFR
jgi:hypothetical protein